MTKPTGGGDLHHGVRDDPRGLLPVLLLWWSSTCSRWGHGFDERGKAVRYRSEVLFGFREIEIKPVPMADNVPETLQLDEKAVEFGTGAKQDACHRSPPTSGPADPDAPSHPSAHSHQCRLQGLHHVFDAVVDVVNAPNAKAEPRAHSLTGLGDLNP